MGVWEGSTSQGGSPTPPHPLGPRPPAPILQIVVRWSSYIGHLWITSFGGPLWPLKTNRLRKCHLVPKCSNVRDLKEYKMRMLTPIVQTHFKLRNIALVVARVHVTRDVMESHKVHVAVMTMIRVMTTWCVRACGLVWCQLPWCMGGKCDNMEWDFN